MFTAASDSGLTGEYLYFFKFMYARCQGRTECVLNLPQGIHLIGENNGPVERGKVCPKDGIKYFSYLYAHIECTCK